MVKNIWCIYIYTHIYIYIYTHTYIHIHIYTQWNITQPLKMNEIMSFAATWLDLEIIILSEISQKEKDNYHMISLICRI